VVPGIGFFQSSSCKKALYPRNQSFLIGRIENAAEDFSFFGQEEYGDGFYFIPFAQIPIDVAVDLAHNNPASHLQRYLIDDGRQGRAMMTPRGPELKQHREFSFREDAVKVRIVQDNGLADGALFSHLQILSFSPLESDR
jgi:hypothetical protein